MEITKKIIRLLKEAIKTKSQIKIILEKEGLARGYVRNFLLRVPISANKKDVAEIKVLYKKYLDLMEGLKGSNIVSESELEEVKKIYYNKSLSWDERMGILIKKYNKSERVIRRWLVKLGLKEKVVEESEQWKTAQIKKHNTKKKRFIISWAQNSTEVHKPFLKNIEVYAKHIDAEILIVPGRYRGRTAPQGEEEDHIWDKAIEPYLVAKRTVLHKYMTLLGDINIIATASDPLNGLEGLTGESSSIIGHPRSHQHSIPVLGDAIPKIMLSTGSITVTNFGDSKVAKKAEFHHTFGFVILEIEDNEIFHVRQVHATSDGKFCDLHFKVENSKVIRVNKVQACILGDLHCGSEDPKVMVSTLKLFDKLHPNKILIHDVFDGVSVSHHTINNPFIQYSNNISGKSSLKNEINYMLEWIDKMQKKYDLVIVTSNHDQVIDKWLINFNWKLDRENMKEYIEYSNVTLNGEAPKGIIPYVINKRFPKIKTLAIDESYKIAGWELGLHGMDGANGARGSVNTFRRLNSRIITGHSHSSSIKDGAVCVGTSTYLKLDYNKKGVSSWTNAHAIIDCYGKAQLIQFVGKNKTYTTLK